MHHGYLPDAAEIERAATAQVETEVAAALGHDADSLRIQTVIARDSAAGALVETSRGADLLVVGSRGLGGFRGVLLGSVSNRCIHHATCPVAVIRGGTGAATHRSGPVVVGIDTSDDSYEALIWALGEAARRTTRLLAVAAWSWLDQPGSFDPGYGAEDVRSAAEAFVVKARAEVGDLDVDVEVRPVNDHPSPALIDVSARAALLVVGSRGLGGFRGLQLGSVSSQVAHHANCPVVIVRRG
jgi:nucleotide-binding universal stress UspA family protein